MKWNESSIRPPLCTYRLNWARRTSWGWWDDTVLQTQDLNFEPLRSEAEHTTSRSRRLPTILTFTRGWGRNIFCFFQTSETGNRTPNSGVKGIVLTTTLGPPPVVAYVASENYYPFILLVLDIIEKLKRVCMIRNSQRIYMIDAYENTTEIYHGALYPENAKHL